MANCQMTTDQPQAPSQDEQWMQKALRVAERGQGTTAENPCVGCVIVAPDNRLLAAAHTAKGGRPHAETLALLMAGSDVHGATAYVTLEPCSHHGQTPPCARALVETGVKRVVIAAMDRDERVSGKGVQLLRDAGVEVLTGVLKDQAEYQLRGFLHRMKTGRPFVMLKMAMSQDGMISAGKGQTTQITGPEFKSRVHLLRAKADAILVGAETYRTDNPSLTCRLAGLEDRSPRRVILGGKELELGKTDLHFAGDIDLKTMLDALGDEGINLLLIEGGAQIANSFIKADLIDEAILATAPKTIGPQGVQAFAGLPMSHFATSDEFTCKSTEQIGQDVVKHYVRKALFA